MIVWLIFSLCIIATLSPTQPAFNLQQQSEQDKNTSNTPDNRLQTLAASHLPLVAIVIAKKEATHHCSEGYCPGTPARKLGCDAIT
jgi:hypothetical protein